MSRCRTRVSDHAVVRYLERAGGFDIASLRRQIALRVDAAARAGADAITIDGLKYMITADDFGYVITTVVPVDERSVVPHQRRKAAE